MSRPRSESAEIRIENDMFTLTCANASRAAESAYTLVYRVKNVTDTTGIPLKPITVIQSAEVRNTSVEADRKAMVATFVSRVKHDEYDEWADIPLEEPHASVARRLIASGVVTTKNGKILHRSWRVCSSDGRYTIADHAYSVLLRVMRERFHAEGAERERRAGA